MRVALSMGILRVPPTYFALQHAEVLTSHVFRMHTLVSHITAPGLRTPVVSAVPGASVLSFRQRELLEPLFLGRMSRQVREWGPDVIHQHFGVWTTPAADAARACDVPWVTTLHGADVFAALGTTRAPMQAWHRHNFSRMCREADLVLAVSHYLAGKAVEAGVPASRLEVLHQGVDTDFFRPARPGDPTAPEDPTGPGSPSSALPLVLHVGALSPAKGIDDLIEASLALRPRLPHGLVLVGDGPLRPRVEEAARHHPHIHLAGPTDRAGVRAWMSRADVLALVSKESHGRREAAGLVALEAQACGTPVVVNDSGGTSEMLDPGVTGLLAVEGDVTSLEHALAGILGLDEGTRRAMGTRARDFVVRERSLAGSAHRLGGIYTDLVGGH